MKWKRFSALGLSLALALSLTVAPARAASFTDLVEGEHWAYEEIMRMAEAGLFNGYEDGSYKPEGYMYAAETLLVSARATGVDTATQAKITADHAAEIAEILPVTIRSWPTGPSEMALAVETGVLTVEELTALSQVDPASVKVDEAGNVTASRSYLDETMSREDIALYLVRAMQLEPLARSQSSATVESILSVYPDKDDIAAELRPYAALLTNYGIMRGKATDEGQPIFDAKGKVKRCEMAAMLCRVLDVKEKYGIVTELSEYTDYAWAAGVISAVSAADDGGVYITLTDPLTDVSRQYTLPADVKLYDDNMLVTASSLVRQLQQRVGKYARINLDSKGVAENVRLSGELTRYEGAVSELEDGKLALTLDGHAERDFTIDRFTTVAVGETVGDRSIIDYTSGYTGAVCYVDEMGHLADVRFTGGTRVHEGLIESVTTVGGVTTLGVAARNGVISTFTVPQSAIVTVGGISRSLSVDQVGRGIKLRVNVENDQVSTVTVDSQTRYVQGPIRKAYTQASAFRVVIADRFTGKETAEIYVSPTAVITYDGETIKDRTKIETGWYATAVITPDENGTDSYTVIEAYPASTQVKGALADVKYASPTVLQVTLEDGTTAEYSFEIDAMPTITRGGRTAAVTDLRKGDSLVLSLRYNQLEKIEATAQEANLTGTITAYSSTTTGATVTVELSNGTVKTYPVTTSISVSQNGVLTDRSALNQPGATVALVTDGDTLLSVNITAAAVSSEQLAGTIYTISVSGSKREMTVLTANNTEPVTVDLSGVNTVADLSNQGQSMALGRLAAGDKVTVYGSYSGATFVATVVIKQ